MSDIEEFLLHIPDEALADLRSRLANTRWPTEETASGWTQGVPTTYLRKLSAVWQDQYDWRSMEKRLNEAGQFTTVIDGLRWHFLHAKSPHPNALPLVMTHGWPGSVREFLDLLDPLTHPADPADAFHVVCPSLPGFGFSEVPHESGWGVRRMAGGIVELMARLGYTRYGAHGGDWGSVITSVLGVNDSEHVAGIHLTIPVVLASPPAPELLAGMNDFERAGMDRATRFGQVGSGYLTQMATKPQTLAFSLADSPVGQAAWILEKFYEWTDCHGDPANALDEQVMLDNITLYWLTNTGSSSSRVYWESMFDIPNEPVRVPAGCSIFPFEHVRVPRAVAEQYLTDLRHWNEMPAGGHFASLEQPQLLLNELRTFFRLVR